MPNEGDAMATDKRFSLELTVLPGEFCIHRFA